MKLTKEELDRIESSANAMMMQGDVQEQGHAERTRALISVIRKQQEVIEKKDDILCEIKEFRLAMGRSQMASGYLKQAEDLAEEALSLTVDVEKELK